jgi:ketosteroid isomerase-like protein
MLPSNASNFETTNPASKKRGGPGAGLVFTIGLLVVLIGVIAFAVTRLPTGTLSRPAQSSAPAQASAPTTVAVANGITADAPTQQAIQDVIQKLDEAQAQAIATNDPNVMAATATPDFYQEQVVTNQDLVANGVTEVKLINLEWGQISVSGNTATATVYETWSTTFDDGTTEQARDRNVYTLIQDNGSWKVQADDHPDQQAAGAPGPAPAP